MGAAKGEEKNAPSMPLRPENVGRIVGVLLMTSGVALFGVFTSFLANTFLSPREKPKEASGLLPEGNVAVHIQELRLLLDAQEQTVIAIRERLAEIEKAAL
jgi:hypothetical protein